MDLEQLTALIEHDGELDARLNGAIAELHAALGELRAARLLAAAQIVPTLDTSRLPAKHVIRALPRSPAREVLGQAWRHVHEEEISRTIADGSLRWHSVIEPPHGVGRGLDERAVEIPLAVDALDPARPGRVLDAGCALNLPLVHEVLVQDGASVTHLTQSAEEEPLMAAGSLVSYVFGDLRELPFRTGWFDRVLCVSTLEHVGMDNSRYGAPAEADPDAYVAALSELCRVLAPDGTLCLTFPFGRPAMHGWFQVFGRHHLERITHALTAFRHVRIRRFEYAGAWRDVDPSTPVRVRGPADPVWVREIVAIRASRDDMSV